MLEARGEKKLMADLLREWLGKTFDERPKGADWNQAWAVLLSMTIFCIVKARNILSLKKVVRNCKGAGRAQSKNN